MTNITPLDFDPERRDRDPEMGKTGSYEGIGLKFLAARRQASLDITHVATSLRIRQEHLAAIEDGRFSDLPAPAYAVGFVRSYAEFLGLDPTTVIQAFKDETENSRERVSLIFPTADAENRVPRGWLLGMSAFLVLVIFGAWFYSEYSDLFFPELVPPAPVQTAEQPVAATPVGPAPVAAPVAQTVPEPVPAATPVPAVYVAAVPEVEDVPFAAGIEAALGEGAPEGGVGNAAADLTVGRVLGVLPVDPDAVGALAANDVAVGDALPEPVPERNVDGLPAVEDLARAQLELVPLPQLVPIPTPAPAVANNIPVVPVAPFPAAPVDEVAPAAETPVPAAEPAAIPAPAPPVPAAEAPVVDAAPAAEPAVVPEPVPAAPEVEVAVLPRPAPEPEPEPAPALAPAPTPAAPAAALTPAAPPAIPAPAVPPAAPQVAGLPGVDPQTFGEEVPGRVVILALRDSWVQITGNAGELLLTRILRMGDRYLAPDREDLILMTGNAGALEITVDGVQVAPLGPVGTVRRNVSLAPDRLLAGDR